MESLTVLVFLALASYRLTRLVVIDEIFSTPRNAFLGWVIEHLGRVGWYINYLFSCTWCLGLHISWFLVSLYLQTWPWDLGINGWIFVSAVAGIQGMIHALEPNE